jgi:hypothetical protein
MGSTGLKVVEDDFLSVEEYLEGEQLAEERHEYVNGHVFTMAGASEMHEIVALPRLCPPAGGSLRDGVTGSPEVTSRARASAGNRAGWLRRDFRCGRLRRRRTGSHSP